MTNSETVKNLCSELRLGSYIPEHYKEIDADTHEDFLITLLRDCQASRNSERRRRYLKKAGFEVMKFIGDFDFSTVTLPADLNQEQLSELEFIERKQNLILYGPPGTGKTHLATALGVLACQNDYKVLFFKASRLVNLLCEAKENGTILKFWNKLNKADLLILDEWGYIPFERLGTQLLFEAVSECYEKRSVILTCNLPFDEWNTIFYDQKLTAAMLDRIVHHGKLIMHNGPSYRLQNSLMQ
ncbi:MAG: ATP-binding protein [Clostridiaceae bacterium]|nr:ATP-binding protein [Clostridiaceae bacterium]